ncbi:hypothetical protein THAOC_36657 [Thalassiosira oceanica]|uniref:Plastid lipid-associated protein/fibrillin conserved domain-containing protein n=1 Tax=Thalassiosira oceanica TaxID=159749 RepID=K0R7U2_THAOC|nr:hypothetical protein THAOC_36657 [Thalassiosira oceanica]|eukprot:EJK44776.1 hypothetical protein THAOC_36657 [Thalassiosira oceanica]
MAPTLLPLIASLALSLLPHPHHNHISALLLQQPNEPFHTTTSSRSTRRDCFLTAAGLVTGVVGAAVGASGPANAGEKIVTASSLLAAIPRTGSGAPATNATVPPDTAYEYIERLRKRSKNGEIQSGEDKIIDNVEGLGIPIRNKAEVEEARRGAQSDMRRKRHEAESNALAKARSKKKGKRFNYTFWLLYSNGPEITSLASGLPLGFELGPTYQPLDVEGGRFENRGAVSNRYGLARLATGVVGDVSVSPPNSLNAVGIANDRNNRVAVSFRAIVFSLDEVFGRPVSVRKVLIPKLDPDAVATPANDVTYLDDQIRIVRGGDGALFVFRRARGDEDSPMLTDVERERLFLEGARKGRSKLPGSGGYGKDNDDAAADVIVGGRKESLKGQPELEFLFQN